MFAVVVLSLVSSVLSQEIGWEEHLQNHLFLCRVGCRTLTLFQIDSSQTFSFGSLAHFRVTLCRVKQQLKIAVVIVVVVVVVVVGAAAAAAAAAVAVVVVIVHGH